MGTESRTKVEVLENFFKKNQEELDTYVANNSTWEEQIIEMHANIWKSKARQEETKKLDRKQLNEDIEVGVHHVEQAQKLEWAFPI